MKDIRHAWAKALKEAGLEHFWLYNLRHSFSSRLSAAGVPDLFVAQMIGHSTPSILQKYSRAIDEYRREAVRKLEQMRTTHVIDRYTTLQRILPPYPFLETVSCESDRSLARSSYAKEIASSIYRIKKHKLARTLRSRNS